MCDGMVEAGILIKKKSKSSGIGYSSDMGSYAERRLLVRKKG